MDARARRDEGLFLALLALVATALEYRFALGNQTEALPLVMHALDPELLARDFYVQSSEGFGPRFYYVQGVAALARLLPLPAVMLGLTALTNVALAAVTHLAARDLLRADRLGGFIAATLALSVGAFPLGLVTDIRFQDLQPGSIAIPFCLGSLWMGLRRRPLRAAALAALGSIPHPLYGLETGGIALGSAAVAAWLGVRPGAPAAERARALLPSFRGGLLLAAAAFALWGLPWIGANAERLPADAFIAVLTFRSPHHYLPSVFPWPHWVLLAAFLFASGLALQRWAAVAPGTGTREDALAFAAAPLAVLGLCAGGILFVEVWPSRLWVTAQPFRMLYLVKWQGFLLLGWLLARWIERRRPPRAFFGWVAFFGTGAAQPIVAAGTLAAERIDDAARRRRPELPTWPFPGLALAASVPLQVWAGDPREMLALLFACALLLCLAEGATAGRRIAAAALVGLLVVFAAANRSAGWVARAELRPVYSLADHRGDDADVARFARDHSDRDAVFHVPPDMGLFRLVARRAVVVDFKALPFSDAALREWRTRMRDAYGEVPGGGFPALARMDAHHRAVDDRRLAAIARRYGARYAVLYAQTRTQLPVLYENDTYKLVELPAQAEPAPELP